MIENNFLKEFRIVTTCLQNFKHFRAKIEYLKNVQAVVFSKIHIVTHFSPSHHYPSSLSNGFLIIICRVLFSKIKPLLLSFLRYTISCKKNTLSPKNNSLTDNIALNFPLHSPSPVQCCKPKFWTWFR